MSVALTEQDFEDSDIARQQFEADVQTLDDLQADMQRLHDDKNATTFDIKLKLREIEEAIEDIENRYEDHPNAKQLLDEIAERTSFSSDLKKILQDREKAADALPLPSDDDFYQGIEDLKALRSATFDTDGISKEEHLERCELFIKEYVNFLMRFIKEENIDEIEQYVERRVGINPRHELTPLSNLKAEKLEQMGDAAEKYSLQDAKQALIEKGIDNPTPDQVHAEFLSEKKALYEAALKEYQTFERYEKLGADLEHYEKQSGFSKEYLEEQLEIIQLEQEILDNDMQRNNVTAQASAPTQDDLVADSHIQSYQSHTHQSGAPSMS